MPTDAATLAATEAEPPIWLPTLVEVLLGSAPTAADGGAAATAAALDPTEVRRLIGRLGGAGGLPVVHDFVDRTLADPVGIVIAAQNHLDRRLDDEERDRFEARALALALAIARTARMRSRWAAVFDLCFHRGEQELPQVARLLAALADARESGRLLIRRLRSRDDDEREYAIYLLAEYAEEPFFGGWLPRLRERAEAESVAYVREAWSRLLARVES